MTTPASDLEMFLKLALAGQEELAGQVMEEVARNSYPQMSDQDFIDAAVLAIQNQTGNYATLMADVSLSAFLSSQQTVAKLYLPREVPPASTFDWQGNPVWSPIIDKAVNDLSRRQVFSRPAFDKLDYVTRQNAFTVANIRSVRTITKVRDSLAEAVRHGQSFRTWMTVLASDVETSHLGVAHGETVYRTNISKATNRGLEKILDDPILDDTFPFAQNLYASDTRLSELCYEFSRAGLGGTAVFLRDDPVWQDFAPPRHWNCRCKAIYLTVKQAANRGIAYAQQWLKLGHRPQALGWVRNPGLALPRGWSPMALV